MSAWQGPPVLVGERTLWLGSGSGLPKHGVIRWIGRLPEIGPDWTVGLELDDALPVGGIDGSWGGRVLFDCRPKHGLLVPISSIIPGFKLKNIPHLPNFEKNKNVPEKNSVVSVPNRSKEFRSEESTQSVVEIPKPTVRQKRRIPTPPSSDSDEPSEPAERRDHATLRVEEREQEDSLKKRLRLFTENHGALQKMNVPYDECALEEVVIDSLYAQRRQQFFNHGRSQSESSHAFVSSTSSPGSRRERSSSAIFSIFRWFRRESRSSDVDAEFAPSAPPSPQLIRGHSTSCGSVDTLFSTATANSFAFVHPAFYRPFGAANPPEKCIISGPETETYRNRLRQRDRIRELDRNLTLKKKYHLFGSGTLHRSVDDINSRHLFLNKSLDSLKVNISSGSKNSTLSRKKRKAPPPPVSPDEKSKPVVTTSEQDKENISVNSISDASPPTDIVVRRHRRTVSDSAKDRKSGAFVHVRGKRKAPPPPTVSHNKEENSPSNESLSTQSLGRKKRHAPPPPLVIGGQENETTPGSGGMLSAEEKQRLINNITKLQAHAERKSLVVVTPPASPAMNTKVSHTVCNDSLKLERGVLKANKTEVQSSESKPVTPTSPTPVSPRPWYKRNAGNKEKSLEKRKEKTSTDDWMPEVAIVRKNTLNNETNNSGSSNSSSNGNSYRLSSIFSRFDKPEEKRKSQISMLANISELDREAAEIVQREQEKERAMLAAQDAKYYMSSTQYIENNESDSADLEIVHTENKVQKSPDSPKRSGARELISLFNAIGNVTKVTVHSAFFSKEGPSIFSKEGVEKRFSMSGEGVKSEERVFKESISKSNGFKRETVSIEVQESYSDSPGSKRRRNLNHQNSDDSSASERSGATSPRVVIEEIDDSEKPKSQVLYEANKVRKHHSPSPSIPTIAEMSESISSMTTSLASTINASERSASVTPTPTASKPSVTSEKNSTDAAGISEQNQSVGILKNKSLDPASKPVDEVGTKQPIKNYSIWSCPRCTLENPRWRVTCEACDMWRPAVRRDVIDKLTNANMGTTIAVNLVKGGDAKNTSAIKNLIPQAETTVVSKDSKDSDTTVREETKIQLPQSPNVKTNTGENINSVVAKPTHLKPITVSGLLNGSCYEPKQSSISEIKDVKDIKVNVNSANKSIKSDRNIEKSPKKDEIGKQNLSSLSITQKSSQTKGNSLEAAASSVPSTVSSSIDQSVSDIEEVRKARLAFFKKSLSDGKTESSNAGKETAASSTSINQAKIDALFSIASKGSLATNEEERLKVKEILKEMKNSLPKRSKDAKPEADSRKVNGKEVVNVVEKESLPTSSAVTTVSSSDDGARLGAIKKSKAQVSLLPSNSKDIPVEKIDNTTAEVYLIKSETIIEEIKMKENSKSPKVSTSVQTSGVVRKIDSNKTSVLTQNEEVSKSVIGKPPTPKSVRKEVTVPVTVEEHVLKVDGVETTVTQETRKMGVGSFNLIRPRDFANIKATKTGSEVKPLHVYVNVPRSVDDDESSSSSSSDSPEITQLSAELTKPKGLADFKASVMEHGAGGKMNTLAVNRLLRQLEAAIAGGQHTRAATLARQLARHKVNCSVTRHRPVDTFTVDVFVEDRLSHQGPYPVQVCPSTTVAQLKAKVEDQFEIPATVQRWILGKQLATDDRSTLQQLGVTQHHCPVFLYLVAPDTDQVNVASAGGDGRNEVTDVAPAPAQEEAAGATAAPPVGRGWYYNEEEDHYSLCESEATDHSSKEVSPEPKNVLLPELMRPTVVEESDLIPAREEELETVEQNEEREREQETRLNEAAGVSSVSDVGSTQATGWKCAACTLINPPERPGCLACGAHRPAEQETPDVPEDQGADKAADEKLKNYQALMVLENADLIPSTEAFECSVCLTECAPGEGVVLRDCLHSFCRACLAHTVQYTEEAEVKCPFRDHQYACDSTLQEREIKAVSEMEEDDSCIVCMAEPRSCALTPCGHRAYCETCCLRLIELDHQCSLCRRKADGYLVIYL